MTSNLLHALEIITAPGINNKYVAGNKSYLIFYLIIKSGFIIYTLYTYIYIYIYIYYIHIYTYIYVCITTVTIIIILGGIKIQF